MTRFARDWPLKLLALALAAFVWLRVVAEQKSVDEMTVPLQIQNLPTDLILSEEVPSKVTVRMRGTHAAFERLKPGDLDARVDLSHPRIGSNFISLTPDDIAAPFGVEVVSITPPSLRLSVHRKIAKLVPVIPDVRGQPPEGYELRFASVNPREVEVEGPEEDVQAASEVTTEVVLLSGRSASFTERVNLDPKNAHLRLSKESQAMVEITIAERTVERSFSGVPVLPRPERPSTIEPSQLTVTLVGPASALGKIQIENIHAYVDMTPASVLPGPLQMAPVVEITPRELGARIAVKEVAPAEVIVKLTGKPGRQAEEDAGGAEHRASFSQT